jgi:replicative DNA helicase
LVETYDISLFNKFQVENLCEELKNTDSKLLDKVKYIVSTTGVTYGEALEYAVNRSPKIWAKVYLNWESRDYQDVILEQGSKAKQLVLRLGRRLGKSECLCVLILWYAFTQINKGPNENQYDIIIITPYENQIDLIFERLHQLIDQSTVIKGEIKRDVYHKLFFVNGAKIQGFTAGTKNSQGGASLRGQRADRT